MSPYYKVGGIRAQARDGRDSATDLGWWCGNEPPNPDLDAALRALPRAVVLVRTDDGLRAVTGGAISMEPRDECGPTWPVAGIAPPCAVESLGDPGFCRDHGIRFPYIAGAMANGIGSVEVVEAMGRAGMLGFFGSAGLHPQQVSAAIDRLEGGEFPFGFNLIHSPAEPLLEAEIAEMFIDRGVRLVEASAFLDLTLPIVRYRVHGIHEDETGVIRTPNRVIAKVSREEVATRFMSPAPQKFLDELVSQGSISTEQARLARRVPMAEAITAEADSGGHTDNRPALSLLPTLMGLRDRMQAQHGYPDPLRVGAAGGVATPSSTAAAFAMGAAYVLTGSINQACVEAATSDTVRSMLAEAQQADVAMAPAADMFEMGVKVQVLKRGTMFAMRAAKLYQLYRDHGSLEEIPAAERGQLEKSLFRATFDDVWDDTARYFRERDPRQIERAEKDPHHKMALVFRWYLGQSSIWANRGEPNRKMDYQIWCGPAIPAFNEWVRGTYLEDYRARSVATLGLNLIHGAALLTRRHTLRCQGVTLPAEVLDPRPLTGAALKEQIP